MRKNYLLRRSFIALLFSAFFMHGTTKANNVIIANLNWTGTTVTFDISWENSWRTGAGINNYDAVWFFVKYQDCATGVWTHATIDAAGHSTAAPLEITTVSDNKGVFIHRSADGAGNIATTTCTVALSGVPGGLLNFKGFGIEMVKTAAEDFIVGDGSSTNTFTSLSITTGHETGGIAGGALYAGSPAVPTAFPVGWDAIFVMKHEISQVQYVDFLNTLSYDQQAGRTAISPNVAPANNVIATNPSMNYNRSGVEMMTSGTPSSVPAVYANNSDNDVTFNETTDGLTVACNYLMWGDIAGYLDWAALRPMTELEFEKICRGPATALSGEYPWGSAVISQQRSDAWLSNYGRVNEISTTTSRNCTYTNSGCLTSTNDGPTRVGCLATAATDRLSSGAAYYGVLDMGGNVSEQVVVIDANGVTFTGTLGDGELSAAGEANVANWPDVTTAAGTGKRGGDWDLGATYVRISDRSQVASPAATRLCTSGGRGVR